MAPWEEAKYFQAPQLVKLTLGGTAWQQLVTGDPMRILLVLSASSGGAISFSPIRDPGNVGISVQNGVPLIINYADYGVLTQMSWYAIGGASAVVTALTLSLYDFPKGKSKKAVADEIAALQAAVSRYGRTDFKGAVAGQ